MNKEISLLLELALPGGQIALANDSGIRAIKRLPNGTSKSAGVLPVVDELLKEKNITKAGIAEIICTRGPGGYTGIRTALSTLAGLRRALQVEVHAYPVFDVLLYGARENETAAAIDAGRNEFICRIAGQQKTTFVKRENLGEFTGKSGILELILSARDPDGIAAQLQNTVLIIDASDNMIPNLWYLHREGHSQGSLAPIYGREIV